MRLNGFVTVASIAVLVALAPPASAYVGPALGISALGAAAAVWTGLVALVSYSVIMPLRSLLRSVKRRVFDDPAALPPDQPT